MTTTTTTQRLEIPFPDGSPLALVLKIGPCRLRLSPSDGPAWIIGSYDDPTGALPLSVRSGTPTTISQGFNPAMFGAALPTLELAISRARPLSLEINAGATETAFDLGGLPLSTLVVKTGAGKFDIDFSQPNAIAMTHLELGTGAGSLSVKRLANANAATLRFNGGVAACALDFGGKLLRDASVRIDQGLGSVDVSIPTDTAAHIRTKAFAASCHVSGGFTQQGDSYSTAPALAGVRPILEIDASVSFGSLTLVTT